MKTYLELQLDVYYTYNPPSRGLRGDYGEPLEPDEDASVEIDDVCLRGLSIIQYLTVEEMSCIEADIWQDIENDF